MSMSAVVASRIGLLILLVALGWGLRRRGWLTSGTTGQLSRLVVDLAFPCLVVVSLVRSVRWSTLDQDAVAIAAGALVVGLSLVVGRLVASFGAPVLGMAPGVSGSERRTFAFAVGTPNWVFLPLLIAQALYGAAGMRVIFMMNVGALVILWTAGITVLKPPATTDGGESTAVPSPWRALIVNPGLIATGLGLVLALGLPQLRPLLEVPLESADHLSWMQLVTKTLLEGLALFGSVTIPLALTVTGAQLGASPLRDLGPNRAVVAVGVLRLFLVPALTAVGLTAFSQSVPEATRVLVIVVAAMPVAVSASLFVQRFEGDPMLAARCVLWTTLASLVTVPLTLGLLSP